MITANTSDQGRDMMLFMIAATFADQIKGDKSYDDDGAPGSGGMRKHRLMPTKPDGRRKKNSSKNSSTLVARLDALSNAEKLLVLHDEMSRPSEQ